VIQPKLSVERVIPAMVVGVALFLFSCKPAVQLKRPAVKKRPSAEQVYSRAEALFAQGKLAEALPLYGQYLKLEPRGNNAPDCLRRMGDIYLEMGRLEEALMSFARVRRDFPGYGYMAEVELGLISSLWKMGALDEVIEEALDWLRKYSESPFRSQVALVLGRAYYAKLRYGEALRWLIVAEEGYKLAEPEKAKEISDQIRAAIVEADESELERMREVSKDTKYYPEIAYRLARMYYGTDRLERAESIITQLLQMPLEKRWLERARELYDKIFLALNVEPHKIGCLLPLTGPFGIYGREVLNGIEIGVGMFTKERDGVEVVIRDTEGDPGRAAEAIENLVRKDHVIAAVGPLLSRCAEQAADRAQALGLPLITICRKADVVDKGPMVFRNFLLPRREIERLVHVAMDRLDIRRFAIMFPDNAYGRYYMQIFWDMVEQRGGQIRAAEPYDPSLTDFAAQIKRMVGKEGPRPEAVLENIRAAWLPEEDESELDPGQKDPIVDFEAVFIPDSAERVAMIAPQLVYHDVVDVWLLGTSLWASPQLIPLAGDYLQGAIFTSGFFSSSGTEEVESFVEEYRTNYESEPGLLAATGYDTIKFLRAIVKATIPKTRNEMRDAIVQSRPYNGITGEISFDQRGEVKTQPFLVTVLGRREILFP